MSKILTVDEKEQIRLNSIFDNLSQETINPFLQNGEIREFGADDTIITEGDTEKIIGIILSGYVRIVRQTEQKREDGTSKEVYLSYYGKNEVIGIINFINDAPQRASIVSLSSSKILFLDVKKFDNLKIDDGYQIYKNFSKIVCEKLIHIDEQIEILQSGDNRTRFIKALLYFAKYNGVKNGKYIDVKLLIGREHLSAMINTTTTGITRITTQLQNLGYISYKYNRTCFHFTIKNEKALNLLILEE
jgi:CRP-like cAMP-binding protein